jgi:cytochrome P450
MSNLESMRKHFQDPYRSYGAARDARLFKDERGIWYAARYDDVDLILKDRRFGKKALPGTEHRLPFEMRQEQHDRLAVLNIDPPDHTRIRGLLTKAFSAKRMEAMRPVVEALVNHIIDRHIDRGAMEIMRDFAFPIPATIISDMLGIPEHDRERFAALSNDIIAFGTGADPSVDEDTRRRRARATTEAFDSYLAGLIATKRSSAADDLTTALIRAEDSEGKLSEAELTQNVRLLFMAGHETTVNLIGNALVALFRHPEELAKVKADPALMKGAVEEFLRFDSSVQQLPRVAQADVDVGGQTILAGEMVICLLGAANRDPAVWQDPEALRIDRPFIRSKSFGGGIHFCLGAQLARIETEAALNTLLQRIPALEMIGLDAVTYPLNPFFRGPERLDARWSRSR